MTWLTVHAFIGLRIGKPSYRDCSPLSMSSFHILGGLSEIVGHRPIRKTIQQEYDPANCDIDQCSR